MFLGLTYGGCVLIIIVITKDDLHNNFIITYSNIQPIQDEVFETGHLIVVFLLEIISEEILF